MKLGDTPPTSPLDYISYRLRSYAEQHDVDTTPIDMRHDHFHRSIIRVYEQTESFDTIVAKSIPHVLGRIAAWQAGERHHLTVYDAGVQWFRLLGLQYNSPEIKEMLDIFNEGTHIPEPTKTIAKNPHEGGVLRVRYTVPLLEVPGYIAEVTSYETFERADDMPEDISEVQFTNAHVQLKFPPVSTAK